MIKSIRYMPSERQRKLVRFGITWEFRSGKQRSQRPRGGGPLALRGSRCGTSAMDCPHPSLAGRIVDEYPPLRVGKRWGGTTATPQGPQVLGEARLGQCHPASGRTELGGSVTGCRSGPGAVGTLGERVQRASLPQQQCGRVPTHAPLDAREFTSLHREARIHTMRTAWERWAKT